MRTKTEIRNVRLYLFWSLLKIPRIFSITGNCKQKIWLKQLKAAPALDFSYFQHASKLVTHHKRKARLCRAFLFLKKGCPEKEEARRFRAGLCCDHRRTDERGVSARDPIWESWDRSSAGPQQRKERYQRQSDICSAAYRRWRTPPA